MPYVAQDGFGKPPYLKVLGNDYSTPDGTGVRDHINVMDLAEGHLAAFNFLTKNSTKPKLPLGEGQFDAEIHIFNLGTGHGSSVLEMVKAFESISGKMVPCFIAPQRPGDIGRCYAQTDKAAQILGGWPDWICKTCASALGTFKPADSFRSNPATTITMV